VSALLGGHELTAVELDGMQPWVDTTAREQFFMPALFDVTAVIEDKDDVCVAHDGEPLGNRY
jgi:hypothetical protein